MKKPLIALLCCLMIASLAACAGAPAANTTPAASADASQAPTSAQAATSAPATEPTAANQEVYPFRLYGNIATEIKEPDKIFFEQIEKALNVKIDVQIPPSSNYIDALTIMMAGGDYPELVLFPDHVNKSFVDGVANGAILPLNEYLDKAPNLKKYSYEVSWNTLRIKGDDKIYGVPRTSVARADGFELRKDWLDKVGITIEEGPVTLDKMTEILTAFTKNDPDGNGVADTYGLGASTSDGNLNVQFGWTFGLIGWQKYDGEDFEYMDLMYSKKSDNFKRALEYTNMLWKNKLIDPDWPTVTTDVMMQRLTQGVIGMRGEFAGWLIQTENNLKKVNPNAQLAYITAVVEKEGDTARGGSFSTGFWGEWAITSSAKQPQRIIDVLDYMLSDAYWETVKYGPEGVTRTKGSDGSWAATEKYKDYLGGRAILRRNDDPGFFITLDVSPENRIRMDNLIGTCIKQAVFSQDQGFRPAIADDPAYIDADKEYKASISKIIVGDLPVSDYDKVLDAWYKAGGQTYIEQMNAGIKAKMGQ